MEFYDVATSTDTFVEDAYSHGARTHPAAHITETAINSATPFSSPVELMRDISDGRLVILVGGGGKPGYADLVMSADHVSAPAINFMATHGRGLVSVALTGARLAALDIARLPATAGRHMDYECGVSIEACEGVTTGISAADRACTIAAVADPKATPSDLCSPGHVFPLIARDGGVLARKGRAEAAIDLTRLAGNSACAVLCEMLSASGEMLMGRELLEFARAHGLRIGSVGDLVDYRCRHDPVLERASETPFRSDCGAEWRQLNYRNRATGAEITVLAMGDLAKETAPVFLHKASIWTDFLGTDSRDSLSLRTAMGVIAAEGVGIVMIVDAALDGSTPGDPATRSGFGATAMDDSVTTQILLDLGVAAHVDLLTWCNRPVRLHQARGQRSAR